MATTPTLRRAETQVNTTDAAVGAGGNNTQNDGQIVALGDGGYVVVWTDGSRAHNPGGTAVVGQRYSPLGDRVGGEFRISQFTNGDQSSPAATALPGGGFAVAFVDLVAAANDIYVRRYDADLNLVGTDSIDDSANQTVDPSISAFADGSYVVSYTVGPNGSTDIEGRLVTAAGVVGLPVSIHSDLGDTIQSELATLSNGDFVAVFQDEDDGALLEDDILFRIFQADGTDVTGPHFASGGATHNLDPDVAALRDGGFVVVHRMDETGFSLDDIRASIYDNAGNFQTSFDVSATGLTNDPDVVALSDGGFVVTWEHGTLVRAQRFDAEGNRIGTEFTVRTGVDSSGAPTAHATLLQDGRFAYAINDLSTGDADVRTSIWGATIDVAILGDVLWRHGDGTVATANQDLGFVTLPWQISGTGDFDGDGDADILWRHVSGSIVTWEMEGGNYLVNHFLGDVSNSWQSRGTGDFDRDGDSDILWRHESGAVVTWEMEDGDYVRNHNIASASDSWQIRGTGDFDGDGDADIIWHHESGAVVTWEMEDGEYVQNHNIASASDSWQIEGAGDFDGDGDADILWHHESGAVVTWEMEDGALVTNHNLPDISPAWQIQGIEDFDSDGDADILFRHIDGQVVTWEMEDGAYLTNHNYGVVANTWQIRGTGEFDGV